MLALRLLWVLVLLGALGCEGTTPRRSVDAGVDTSMLDAPSLDAPGMDAPGLDAPPIDAPLGMDARIAMDAGMDAFMGMDAGFDSGWGTCSYGGVMGVCMSVSSCTGMARAGLCPGPSDIQCCLPTTDAGPRPDAPGAITPADVIARLGACNRIGGDYARDSGGTENIPVCQTANVIWWNADFDIDCDGGSSALCMSDPYYQPETSGVDSHGDPLDASTLPFIVIPLASSRFRYADHAIRVGQVALVLYRDRMVFGIFGDAGPAGGIGEGSFAMAEALGIPSDPRTGGVDSGVTYLVFTGTSARVAHNESHAEAIAIGQPLLETFLGP